jgi:hypothetical protein
VYHETERRTTYTNFLYKNPKERTTRKTKVQIAVLKWILKKLDRRVWAKFIWLRIGTSGGPL